MASLNPTSPVSRVRRGADIFLLIKLLIYAGSIRSGEKKCFAIQNYRYKNWCNLMMYLFAQFLIQINYICAIAGAFLGVYLQLLTVLSLDRV